MGRRKEKEGRMKGVARRRTIFRTLFLLPPFFFFLTTAFQYQKFNCPVTLTHRAGMKEFGRSHVVPYVEL